MERKLLAAATVAGALAFPLAAISQDATDVIDRIYDKENRTIQLDADDPGIDAWSTKRDFSKDNRPPGPINVQRYDIGTAYTGVPTFFRLPIAVTPDDLVAGDIDVAILGSGVVSGGGRPGATMAASFVRLGEPLYPWGPLLDTTITEILLDPFKELKVVDYGDINVDPFSVETSIVHAAEIVEEVAATGTVPIMVGGDHASLYPNIVGIGRAHGKGNFSVIHIDAHADNGGSTFGHYVHIGSMNRLAVDEGWVKGENMIQAGMRSPAYSRDYINWWPQNNAHLFMMAEFRKKGFHETTLRIAKILKNGPGKVYVSIDIDVLEPGLAPAVTGPELGGMTTRELIEMIRTIAVSSEIIGMDFVEYNPMLDDAGGTTRTVVSRLIRESLGAIALAKSGVTEPFYYAPETDHDTREKLLEKQTVE